MRPTVRASNTLCGCHQPHALWEPPPSAPRITLDVIDPRHCAAAAASAAASYPAACTPDTVVEREAFTEGLAAFKLAVARAPKMVPIHTLDCHLTRARTCRGSVSAVMVDSEAAGLHVVLRVACCMLSVAR